MIFLKMSRKIIAMRYWTLLLILIIFIGRAQANPEIINYIENHLQLSGVLKKSGTFVYVDVDDAYIHQLIPFIEHEGFEEPPYFDKPYSAGAHISVIYSDENFSAEEIEEYGQEISFTLKECQIVHPPKWAEIEKVYFIVVEAPELDQLREKYGLTKREYPFHITIGVKPRTPSKITAKFLPFLGEAG
ncbi:MAG: hypothetical protein JSS30_04250 [Verrucomicrobia bacterium]|nr:hypothetical protein [Verrucomicrobiota bacterium]